MNKNNRERGKEKQMAINQDEKNKQWVKSSRKCIEMIREEARAEEKETRGEERESMQMNAVKRETSSS
jgi:hypothetical protein